MVLRFRYHWRSHRPVAVVAVLVWETILGGSAVSQRDMHLTAYVRSGTAAANADRQITTFSACVLTNL